MTEREDHEKSLNIDQEVDLLEYLFALLKYKYRILLFSIFIGGAVFAFSKTIENQYRSSAVLAVNIQEGFGGVKSGRYRGSDVVGLLEYDFVLDQPAENERDRLLARLSGTDFVEIFIQENNLLEYIFRDKWDLEKRQWTDGFLPSMVEASKFFRSEMLLVSIDAESGLLVLSMSTNSAQFSARLANAYYQRFNEYIREKRLSELKLQSAILNERLNTTAHLELKRSIYRMLETQLAEEITLNAKQDYPLELIQRADPPLFKAGPNRKVWTILSLVLSCILGVVMVIGSIIWKKLAIALQGYGSLQATAQKNESSAEPNSKKDEASANVLIETSPAEKDIRTRTQDELDEWLD